MLQDGRMYGEFHTTKDTISTKEPYNHFNKIFGTKLEKIDTNKNVIDRNKKNGKNYPSEIERAFSDYERWKEDDEEKYANLSPGSRNMNKNNRMYIPPPHTKGTYLTPKVFSASLSMRKNKLDKSFQALDFGISEMVMFKTKFPQSLSYEVMCDGYPPYLCPMLVSLLRELDNFVPPLFHMTSGTTLESLESADALVDVMLRVSLKENIPKNVANLFLYNVHVRVLTNTLQVLLQRFQYPLFLATTEFCEMVTFNIYNIKLVRFGCSDFNRDNLLVQALGRCLGISSNFQVANLAYLVETCQRWMREEVKCELDKHKLGSADLIFEESAATLSMILGKIVVGIPKHYVAHKIMKSTLPLIDDLRRTIFYFLLGIPSFEYWHLWSINTLGFEDSRLKCKSKRGAFMDLDPRNNNLEALPYL